VTGGQGVAGSNPAVPTVFEHFGNQMGMIMAGHPRERDAASLPVRAHSCP